jgi:hypothetical protein
VVGVFPGEAQVHRGTFEAVEHVGRVVAYQFGDAGSHARREAAEMQQREQFGETRIVGERRRRRVVGGGWFGWWFGGG